MSDELLLTGTPPEPPADWLEKIRSETQTDAFTHNLSEAVLATVLDAASAGWRKGWRAAIEYVGDQIAGVDIVQAERERIAKLFCKDCESGRPRSRSSLLGGTPRWFHATGAASGRNCEAAPVWGEPRQ